MKFKKTAAFMIWACLAAFPVCGGTSPRSNETGSGRETINKAIQVLREMTELVDEGLPPKLLEKCRGVAVIPDVIKAAYGLGGQFGRGVVLIRNETGSWSDPTFIRMIGGSVGWQIGVQKSDIVLLFMTPKSVENIASGKITLGADISVAAGPVGRDAEASTDLAMEAEIYSYSKSKGLFAGISIKGASLRIDKDADAAFYGVPGISAEDILQGRGIEAPPEAGDLKKILEKRTARRI
jgi:lipid-binding SYLF domain-containing protein